MLTLLQRVMRSFKLCLETVAFEHYTFIPVLVTLINILSYRCGRKMKLKILFLCLFLAVLTSSFPVGFKLCMITHTVDDRDMLL